MGNKKTSLYYYEIGVYNAVCKLAPTVSTIAALTFSISYAFGYFSDTSLAGLIVFDVISVIYIVLAAIYGKRGILDKDGFFDKKRYEEFKNFLALLIIVQWNLISYIFPTRSFWGFLGLFALIPAFFFDASVIDKSNTGLAVSVILSWIIKGDQLLPVKDDTFIENIILRIIASAIVLVLIWMLADNGAHFKKSVEKRSIELESKNNELKKQNDEILLFAANIVELRDEFSGTHIKRVKTYTKILANQVMNDYPEYGLNKGLISLITETSILHDVGKIKIPDEILLKPGKLTPEEFKKIKTHCEIGASIIDSFPGSMPEEYKRMANKSVFIIMRSMMEVVIHSGLKVKRFQSVHRLLQSQTVMML